MAGTRWWVCLAAATVVVGLVVGVGGCANGSGDETPGALPHQTAVPMPRATEPREAPAPTPVPGSDAEYQQNLVAGLDRLDAARAAFGDMLLSLLRPGSGDLVVRAEFDACADRVIAAAVEVRAIDPPPVGEWVEVDGLIHEAMDRLTEATELYRAGVLNGDDVLLDQAGVRVVESDELMEQAAAAIP